MPNTALLILLSSVAAHAAFTYPDCPDWKPSEFRYDKLIDPAKDSTLDEPVRMAFNYRGDGKSDVYFAERHGDIKRWDAVKDEITVLGHLDVFSDAPDKLPDAAEAETGINGIALDPGFKENRRLWVFYSPWEDSAFRLSYFTLKDGKMDMGSEKVLLDIKEGRKHAFSVITLPGGPLQFDPEGDLWIAIGANSEQWPSVDEKYPKLSAEASSSNLADLRGSILRIHPDDSPRGYGIPEGNLGDYWAAKFDAQGESELADAYRDTARVRPEIYIKGTRNPYSLNVDPKTGWVVWGDFGPNRDAVEELNLANHPLYAGYPYWAGRNIFVLGDREPWASAGMDPAAPVNVSVWNRGPRELPPAEPAVIAYKSNSNDFLNGNYPTSGPIYRYLEESDSPVKFPPHFDGAWMAIDRYGGLRMFQVNDRGDGYVDSSIFRGAAGEPAAPWLHPIELKQGPDGAVYVLDYAGYHSTVPETHIGRYAYQGSCHPGAPVGLRRGRGARSRIRIFPDFIRVDEAGIHAFRLRTLDGRVVASFSANGPAAIPLRRPRAGAVYVLTLEPGRGRWLLPPR